MISSATGTEAVVILGKGSVSSLREYSVYLSTLMATPDWKWLELCSSWQKKKNNQKRVSVLMMLKSIIITQKRCNMYEKQPKITPFFMVYELACKLTLVATRLLAHSLLLLLNTELLIGSPIWRPTESDSDSGLMNQIQDIVILDFQILTSVCTGRKEGQGPTATLRQRWLIEGMNGMLQS